MNTDTNCIVIAAGAGKRGKIHMIFAITLICCLIAAAAYLTVSFAQLFVPFGFEGVNYGFAMLLVGSIVGGGISLFWPAAPQALTYFVMMMLPLLWCVWQGRLAAVSGVPYGGAGVAFSATR